MKVNDILILIGKYAKYYRHELSEVDTEILIGGLRSYDSEDVKSAFEKITSQPDAEFFPKLGKILNAIKEVRDSQRENRERGFIKHPCQVNIGDSRCGAESFCNIGYCWKPQRTFFICHECFQVKQEEERNAKR